MFDKDWEKFLSVRKEYCEFHQLKEKMKGGELYIELVHLAPTLSIASIGTNTFKRVTRLLSTFLIKLNFPTEN